MKKGIAIIGYVESALSAALEHKLVELASMGAIINAESKRVVITQHPLTPKQIEVIKAMQAGAFIETTLKCSRCNGIHLTTVSMKQLHAYGLIKQKCFIGHYSSEHELTDKGKFYAIK